MKLKIYLLLAFFTVAPLKFYAQNTLSVQAVEVGTNTDFDLNVSLQNQDNIAALQFDINYNATAFALLSGHELTSAAPNHSLSVSTPSPGVVRVIIFSTSNAVLNPGSGLLLRLKMKSKTLPGTFNCGFNNVVGSSATSTAILISGINQNVMVKGSILSLLTTSLNFGRVPIGSTPTQQISIQNTGNLPLVLNGNTTIAPFTIVDSYPITISPNETKNITVGLNTTAKINTTLNLGFQNNDPDPIRNIRTVDLSATVYAVNEIHIGNGSGVINTEIEIPVYVNNMELFNGFQFDVLLPADISYVNNSIIPSQRSNAHTISASIINGNTLRFIAYSSSNKDFNGKDGELFRFKLKPAVASGTYNLNISNPILSNATLGNIESDSFNGFVQINSPNLTIDNATLSYGNVPITESRTSDLTLYNTGSSLLIIDSIVKSSGQIEIEASLPIEILPGASKMVALSFKPTNTGSFSETVSFRYNGPDLQKILNVQSTIFSPNYLMVKNQVGIKNQLNNFSILLMNTDAVRAIQFDVELPLGFDLQSSNLTTTSRSGGFNVSASLLSANKYRILLYSFSNSSLSAGTESIINFPVSLTSNLVSGNYSFIYSNVILSNTTNQNISSLALEDGKITLNDAPIAVAEQITVVQGGTATTLAGGSTNVLINDTDAENNILTAILVSGVSNGTLILNGNGTFSYVHNGSKTTSDSFSYKANDGNSDSNIVTVMITVSPVNVTPIAVADQITVAEGETIVTLVGGASSVLTNDADAENNALTAILVSDVSNGALILNSNGTFSYTHDGSETISDSFSYKANDGNSDSNIVTVTIIVSPVNDAPIAVADQITVVQGGTATTLAGGSTNVLINDTDAENNILTAILVSGVSNGTLILNDNGTFSYVHNGSETISDSFSYKANDGNSDSNIVTVMITVSPMKDFTLPSNNFNIEIKGETCTNKNNGELIINAAETHDYVATINGTSYNFTNNNLSVSNLAPGIYNVCITVIGKKFEQCYSIVITKGTTVTGKLSMSSNKVSVEIVEGTAPYQIFVNRVAQFETQSPTFSIDVKQGDLLEVKTAKPCEGIYSKGMDDLLGSISSFPNPTTGIFEIALPISRNKVVIDLYTITSQLIFKKSYPIVSQKVQLNLENESAGIYIIKIYLDTPIFLKIIKK
ncbi:Ig-like domain-containing protein [Flavobacterium acetivorans]|uniref:Ig-like domain-containing protein n=1 Tax=Flavobacterium acetivorans TaxID=2893883 RepID=UPI001E294E72|nr:Ig-like domain-containing protein [Flavobacterium sp. F-29]UFH35597.1 Ig-like domain-containing protein [Flavobacterium sp. F-29]